MTRYLDENGVAKLWARIQRLVYECSEGDGSCTCTSLTDEEIDEATPMESEVSA